MKKTMYYEKCIVCLEPINRGAYSPYNERRGKQCLTCSRKCATIYSRISQYARKRIKILLRTKSSHNQFNERRLIRKWQV